jgi:(E)-4-hydroxy-3-methylbut-2-enyl-diphosphate synthase
VESRLSGVIEPIKVAVMGCVVNGPGEAKSARVGGAGGRGQGNLFRAGEMVRKVPESELADTLVDEVLRLINTRKE